MKAEKITIPPADRISLKEKIGYSFGDAASNLYWKTFEWYLMFFYTDVFGISAAAVGTMLMVTRLADAVADPVMGSIADRTKTRWGHFRPYVLWGALPLAVAGVFTFTTPHLSGGGKVIYAYITYCLLMFIYTAVNIPYSALMGVISPNSLERTSISSIRFIGAFTAGTFIQYFTLKFVGWFGQGNDARGWQLTMVFYGILAIILLVLCFLTTHERVTPPVHIAPKWNRPFFVTAIAFYLFLIAGVLSYDLATGKILQLPYETGLSPLMTPTIYIAKQAIYCLLAVIIALTGVGLLLVYQWARRVTVYFSLVSGLLFILTLFVRSLHTTQQSTLILAIAIVLNCAIIFYLINQIKTFEQDTAIKRDLGSLFSSVPWIMLVGVLLLVLAAFAVKGSASTYYFKYYLHRESLVGAFMVVNGFAFIAAVMLATRLTKIFGKKPLFIFAIGGGGLVIGGFCLPGSTDITMIFALQIISSFIIGFNSPLVWAMFADTADHAEWRTGRRNTGLFFASAIFATKVGFAFGAWIFGLLLTFFGYEANVEQSARSMHGIILSMSWIPCGLMVMAAVLMLLYPLSDPLMVKIEAELKQRRGEIE